MEKNKPEDEPEEVDPKSVNAHSASNFTPAALIRNNDAIDTNIDLMEVYSRETNKFLKDLQFILKNESLRAHFYSSYQPTQEFLQINHNLGNFTEIFTNLTDYVHKFIDTMDTSMFFDRMKAKELEVQTQLKKVEDLFAAQEFNKRISEEISNIKNHTEKVRDIHMQTHAHVNDTNRYQ